MASEATLINSFFHAGIMLLNPDILSLMEKKKLSLEFEYYVLLFFILAFTGWLWEVALFFFTEHAFINRGVYRGPDRKSVG